VDILKLKLIVTTSIVLFIGGLLVSAPQNESFAAPSVPLPPDTGNATYQPETELPEQAPPPEVAAYPMRISIPSLKLDDQIVGVGVNDEGEMDVPSGATTNVGWYKYGTIPGDVGTAVLGAHVFAAFSKLNRAKLGSNVYINLSNGKKLHFVVSKMRTYALSDINPQEIFTSSDGQEHLTLITCAGTFIKSKNTYDHRLVVYATLVD
jgi:LPXTG-site transpeptidase (sortase) family protein